jgi:ABC-type sugar transport system permease subunit
VRAVEAQPHPEARRRPAARRFRRTDAYLALIFTLPTLIVVLGLTVYPWVYSAWLSLNDVEVATWHWSFVGLQNYTNLVHDPQFWSSLATTAKFSGIAVATTLFGGLFVALVLNEAFRGRGLVRSLVLIPWAMSPVITGVLWSWILNGQYGVLDALLHRVGIVHTYISWLAEPGWALPLVAIVYSWTSIPLAAFLLLAALQSIPPNLYGAAKVDGAGGVARFFRITLPWLRSTILLILLVVTIDAVMQVALIYLMTQGGPGSTTTVFAWLGYQSLYQNLHFGQGAAMLYTLSLITLFVGTLYFVLLRERKRKPSGRGSDGNALQPDRSGSARFASIPRTRATATVVQRRTQALRRRLRPFRRMPLYASLTLVIAWSSAPFIWLILSSFSTSEALLSRTPRIHFTLSNYEAIFGVGGGASGARSASISADALAIPHAIGYTATLCAIVAVINVVLASLAGYGYARFGRSRLVKVSFALLLLTRMIPALVILLPFYILFLRIHLIGSMLSLVLTYSAFVLPIVVWILRNYFLTLPISVERAALVDGCTWPQLLRRVVLPMAKPALIAGGVVAFLAAWNEFLYALVLGARHTMAITIASFADDIRFGGTGYGILFASGVIAALPPVIFSLAFQKYLVKGISSGGTKG